MDLLDCNKLVFLNGLAEDFKATVCFLPAGAFDYPRNIDNFSSEQNSGMLGFGTEAAG